MGSFKVWLEGRKKEFDSLFGSDFNEPVAVKKRSRKKQPEPLPQPEPSPEPEPLPQPEAEPVPTVKAVRVKDLLAQSEQDPSKVFVVKRHGHRPLSVSRLHKSGNRVVGFSRPLGQLIVKGEPAGHILTVGYPGDVVTLYPPGFAPKQVIGWQKP